MLFHNFAKVGDLGNIAFFENVDHDQILRTIRINPKLDTWYSVDTANPNVLIKTTDSGATAWTTVSTRTNDIIAIFHDQVGEFLYCIEGDHNGGWFLDTGGAWQVFKVDLSDDTVSNVGGSFGVAGNIFNDIFYMNEVCYVYYGTSTALYIRDVLAGTNDTVQTSLTSILGGSQGTVYNDAQYYCAANSATASHLYSFNGSTVTLRYDFDNISRYFMDSLIIRNRMFQEGIYLILPVWNGSIDHNFIEFWRYNMSTEAIDQFSPVWDFNATTTYPITIRQRDRYDTTLPAKMYFLKVGGLGNGDSETRYWEGINFDFKYYADITKTDVIIWSSDRFVLNDNYEILEYKQDTKELFGILIERAIGKSSFSKLSTPLVFDANQKITLKDDEGKPIFIGNVTKKEYSGGLRTYDIKCLDKEIYTTKFTASFIAKTAKEIMESILTSYGNWLTFEPGSIDSGFTATYTLDFKNVSITEAFGMLMDYEDGVWYVTPEGVVYAKKVANILHGHTTGTFIGEFSFTAEDDWEEGISIGWISFDDSGGDCKAYIRPYLDGHKKVLDCHNVNAGGVDVASYFTSKTSGTTEAYIRINYLGYKAFIGLRDGTSDQIGLGLGMGATATKFSYLDNGTWYDIDLVYEEDTWYHIRIDWEGTAGGYQSLAQYKYQIFINGVNYGPYNMNSSLINYTGVTVTTPTEAEPFHFYVDSVDHSWSSGFYFGRNMEDWLDIDETSNNIVGEIKLVEILSQYNKITIYGGIVGSARLIAVANNTAHQDEFGIIEYIDHFPRVRNQTDLNTLATAILNRTGITNNPRFLRISLTGVGYLQTGTLISLKFTYYEELSSIESYHVLLSKYDPLSDIGTYIVSTGLVQQGREHVIDLQKTSDADEEQIDIIADTYIGSDAPQMGGDLDMNSNAFCEMLTAAVSLIRGDLCYMNTAGKMDKAQGDTQATCATLLAICTETIAADAEGKFVLNGKFISTGLTAGEYFVSAVLAGAITSTKPSGTGDIIRKIGTAVSTTVLYFNPSQDYLEHV